MQVNLSVNLAGISLKNPVMNASGTVSLETADFTDLSLLGALVTKGVTLKPRSGNVTPRLCETPCGVINSIGLENSGLEVFLAKELTVWLSVGPPVIVNISGNSRSEYQELAKSLDQTGIVAIEANFSCPNKEGLIIGTDRIQTRITVELIKEATGLPVIVKLTPNVTDIVSIAQAAIDGGANALSLVNTFLAMDIDIETGQPKIGRGFGGLSGPAILPQALFKVWQVCQAVNIPVIGMGGIRNFEDAVKFLMVGAKAVAIGTANFSNRLVMPEIIEGLEDWMRGKEYSSIAGIPRVSLAQGTKK